MRIGTRNLRIRIPRALVLAMALLIGLAPVGVRAAQAQPVEERGSAVEGTLERLSDVLGCLEAELAKLEAPPAAERVEDGLEAVLELIHELLSDDEQIEIGERILKLDLMLHRLVYVLEEIVENAPDSPAKPRARGALEDLRGWIDGYVDGVTSGMRPREAKRFEDAAHQMARSLGQRLSEMAQRAAPPERSRPVLARLVERLEELLFKLDGLILHHGKKDAPQP